MPERLSVNITVARDRNTGQVVTLFQYTGAMEMQMGNGQMFVMEFRGRVLGTPKGDTPEEQMADAEAKVKAEIQRCMDSCKMSVPNIVTIPETARAPEESTS